MTGLLELGQNALKKLKFTSNTEQVFIVDLVWIDLTLHLLKDERMITNLTQLHDSIVKTTDGNGLLIVSTGLQVKTIALSNHGVEALLKSRHWALDNLFNLIRELSFNVLLQTAKQERTKDLVQTANDKQCFFFIQFNLFTSIRKWSIEPLIKGLA